jgi:SAM-dependent methyltransferase
LNDPRETELQSMLAARAYGPALALIGGWISDEPLSSQAFKWLAEVRGALGESDFAVVALQRAQQLTQIESNTKSSALGERYRALSASLHDGIRLSMASFQFTYLGLKQQNDCTILFGASLCGKASIRIHVAGPVEKFQNECSILKCLTAGNCQTAAALIDCGELSPSARAVVTQLADGEGLNVNLGASVLYHICDYIRADRGRFGTADLVLALLEQQALGVYQNNITLSHLSYDSVARVYRFSDFTQAGYLDPSVRELAPKAYLEWCAKQERERVAAGGEASYLLGSLVGSDWIWLGERLNLLSTQAFIQQRIGALPEPSIQTIKTDELTCAGTRDWSSQRSALAALKLGRYESMLDLGCGLGAAAHYFSNDSRAVTGVDVEPRTVISAAMVANITGCRADFIDLDLDYQMLAGRWSIVLALSVLHHYANRSEVCGKINRLCQHQLILECGLEEQGYKWTGRFYQRVEPWSFSDCAALRAALLEWFPAFQCKRPPQATDSGRWLFMLERKEVAS